MRRLPVYILIDVSESMVGEPLLLIFPTSFNITRSQG